MNLYELGGIGLTAIVATVGIIKLELIKEAVKKMTSDKGAVNIFSILILLVISVLPALIGFTIPANDPEGLSTGVQDETHVKTDGELILEGSKDAILIVKELTDESKKKKDREDSIFNANKTQRWVFQIGDLVDNDDALEELYKTLKETQGICVFKYKRNYFLFRNEDHSKIELEDSLASFKTQMGSVTVAPVDLMSFCSTSKEKLVKTKSMKFGRRKDKIEIDCYTVDK
jgi:hypothetical protein